MKLNESVSINILLKAQFLVSTLTVKKKFANGYLKVRNNDFFFEPQHHNL